MIEFSVKIPTKGPINQEEEDRIIWAIYFALTLDMKQIQTDIPNLILDRSIVERK